MTLFGELVPSVPPESTQQVVGYPSLFLLVVLGSLVPVVPTGALVSSAAVVAFHHTSPFALLMVFVVASSAAFLGDVGLYSLGRRGSHSPHGSRWLARLRARAAPERLDRAQHKLRDTGSWYWCCPGWCRPGGSRSCWRVCSRRCHCGGSSVVMFRRVWRGRRRISSSGC